MTVPKPPYYNQQADEIVQKVLRDLGYETSVRKPTPIHRPQRKRIATVGSVRRKILLDLLVSPITVIPTVLGASTLMLCWAINSYGPMAFVGVIGVLAGVGAACTKFVLNVEKLAETAVKEIEIEQNEETEAALDQLSEELGKIPVVRGHIHPANLLRQLRALYRDFKQDFASNKIIAAPELVAHVDEINSACVESLRYSNELLGNSASLSGDPKKQILAEREHILEQVEHSIDELSEALVQYRALGSRNRKNKLSNLTSGLAAQLEAARRTNERVSALDGDTDLTQYDKLGS